MFAGRVQRKTSKKANYVFGLVFPERTHFFNAESDEEATRWLAALDRIISSERSSNVSSLPTISEMQEFSEQEGEEDVFLNDNFDTSEDMLRAQRSPRVATSGLATPKVESDGALASAKVDMNEAPASARLMPPERAIQVTEDVVMNGFLLKSDGKHKVRFS